jgi:hypothetical protein
VCVGSDFPKKERIVKVLEAAIRELADLPETLRASTLGAAVLDLARRLDAGPADREAVDLARELRIALGALHAQAADRPEGVLDVGDASLGH